MVVPLVLVKSLSKSFGKKRVLHDVNFKINKGEIFGIIGLSGEGKTTLLNSLVGNLEHEHGEVIYLKKNLLLNLSLCCNF